MKYKASVATMMLIALGGFGGCVSVPDVTPRQLANDIARTTKAQCTGYSLLSDRISCLDGLIRPVWMKESPATADLYEGWNNQSVELANAFDAKKISGPEVKRDFEIANKELWNGVIQRENSEAIRVQNENEQLELMGTAFLSGLASAQPKPSAPIFTTCTHNGSLTNCTTY